MDEDFVRNEEDDMIFKAVGSKGVGGVEPADVDNAIDNNVDNDIGSNANKPGFLSEFGMKAMVVQSGGSLSAMKEKLSPEEQHKADRKKIIVLLFAVMLFSCIVVTALGYRLFSGYVLQFDNLSIVAAVVGSLLLGVVSPYLSSLVLARKRRKRDKWFDDELEHLQKKLAMDYTYKPNRKDPGADGALGIWFDDCVARDKMKKLSYDQVERLKQTGLFEPAYPMVDYSTAEELVSASERSVSKKELVVLAVFAALYAPLLVSVNTVAASCVIAAMLTILTTLAFCDQKSRLLPLELTSVLLPLSLVCAYFRGSWDLLMYGCLVALVCFVVLYAVNWISNFIFHKPSIGKGDVKLIPVCALPLGMWPGLFGALIMSLTMVVYSIFKTVGDASVGKGTKFPMGWFIMLGFAAGCVVPF